MSSMAERRGARGPKYQAVRRVRLSIQLRVVWLLAAEPGGGVSGVGVTKRRNDSYPGREEGHR